MYPALQYGHKMLQWSLFFCYVTYLESYHVMWECLRKDSSLRQDHAEWILRKLETSIYARCIIILIISGIIHQTQTRNNPQLVNKNGVKDITVQISALLSEQSQRERWNTVTLGCIPSYGCCSACTFLKQRRK